MKRTLTGFIIGLPITFLIFVFMSLLVEIKADRPKFINPEVPKLDRVLRETEIIIPPRANVLPEQEPLIKQPKTTKIPSEETPVENNPPVRYGPGETPGVISFVIPPIGDPENTGQGSQEAVPVLITEPRWPAGVATGGFVRLCFSILPDGKPANIVVMDAAPGRAFVKSAKRAVYKWKFRPSYVNGVAIEQNNMCYTLDFELEE